MSLTRQSYIGSPEGTLDFVPYLFLAQGMPLLLRKTRAQARIEGWDPRNRSDDDYAVVDDTIVGRNRRDGQPFALRCILQRLHQIIINRKAHLVPPTRF